MWFGKIRLTINQMFGIKAAVLNVFGREDMMPLQNESLHFGDVHSSSGHRTRQSPISQLKM